MMLDTVCVDTETHYSFPLPIIILRILRNGSR